ncbi:MAG: thioredoxin domain-containing protein [Deltaproteobacteria bacterium]|nr:thioredoxin domain-containing protein [Deltaproteobacteria bacterium]
MNYPSEGEETAYNHLIREKSPYLLQHATNPVDWYPWGHEAFELARKQGKPVFLSVGYATCHWCHVMAHESFEDETIAQLLNGHFVAIKVDREERPDIDQIYMTVCRILTGQGGWPLSIFMTPEGKPFFAGTYFPKRQRMGMPGFENILEQIAGLWKEDQSRILSSAEDVTGTVQAHLRPSIKGSLLDINVLERCYQQLAVSFDSQWGGFSTAPKFPMPHNLTFLLRWHRRTGNSAAREMVEKTLISLRQGGIFDHIGFGFHRYSVDDRWLVPHFEKMLYDQALLSMAYTEAFQATQRDEYKKIAGEIFSYVLRDMTAPEGGFYSAEDADSEGKEGLFYLWSPDEVLKCLGNESGNLMCRFYGISPEGNFEGRSIPHMTASEAAFADREGMAVGEFEDILQQARSALFQVREKRAHPLKDDKILTAWNGLMIAALAKGHGVVEDVPCLDAARAAADFILKNLRRDNGRLYRRYREGEVAHPGYLDDYAFFIWGLIELYQATFDIQYLEEAVALNALMIDLFWDGEHGGFFLTGKEDEVLIARSKNIYDGAEPSGNSIALLDLLRLGRLTGDTELEKKADQMARTFSEPVLEYPIGHCQFLNAIEFMVGPSPEIVIAGITRKEAAHALIDGFRRKFFPNTIIMGRSEDLDVERVLHVIPFVREMKPIDDKTTFYLCEQFACSSPMTELSEVHSALG